MKVVQGVLDCEYALATVDPRIFGSFVEMLGRCVYSGIYEPGHPEADAQGMRQDVLALVRELRPAALLCVDSLCSAEPERLGRTLQFSDTGLHPAQPDHSRHLDAARLGVPVLAAGIPTLMQAEEGRDLVVTPRDLDGVIAHGAALLGAAINRALQPKLSVAQLCWLTG